MTWIRRSLTLLLVVLLSASLVVKAQATDISNMSVEELMKYITSMLQEQGKVDDPTTELPQPSFTPLCDGKMYSVDQLSGTSFINIACSNTLTEAMSIMKDKASSYRHVVVRYGGSYSPMKIAAASSAYAVASIGTTLTIYRTAELSENNRSSDWSTYVANGIKMYYLDSQFNSKNELVYKVAISGYEGYVDAKKVDLVPTVYLVEDRPFTIRDGLDQPKQINQHDVNFYQVVASGQGYNELYYFTASMGRKTDRIGPYSKAPSWLPVGYYYSRDGITFYRDPYFMDVVNPTTPFYNYFQYLPLRSRSNVPAQVMDNFLLDQPGGSSSAYYGKSQEFINNQERYGINALLVFSLANLESAFGTSHYARTKNNLFGWNAIDSNPDLATDFTSVEHSIAEHMGVNLFGYTDILDWRFVGPSVGDKGSGFNAKYASDPNWGLSISALAYQADKKAGFIDYNAYQLGKIKDGQNVNVRQSPSTYSSILYTTNGYNKQLKNQTLAITGSQDGFYEFVSWYPINYGLAITQPNGGNYHFDYNNNSAYIARDYVDIVNSLDYVAGRLPGDPKVDEMTKKPNETPLPNGQTQYRVLASVGLRVRSLPTTLSSSLGVLPQNTIVSGSLENGWVKIQYKNQTGYISGEFVQAVQVNKPSTETVPSTASKGLGDLNGDGQITTIDLVFMQRHLLGIKELSGTGFQQADINKDGRITTVDLVHLQRHLLGIKALSN